MATSNVSRILEERYTVAVCRYSTDRYEECLIELSELLMDDALSPVFQLKANAAPAETMQSLM